MKVAVVIPCHNEARAIGRIVQLAKDYVDGVIVVDDGSTDDTSSIAHSAGATVVGNEQKQGFGASVKLGMDVALIEGYDAIITMDGDGQHNPCEIPKVLERFFSDGVDIAIGSRFLGEYEITFYRKVGIDVITWLVNMGSRFKVTDSQSCFRVYKADLLKGLDLSERGFGFSTEVLIKARKSGCRICEVPIQCIYHDEYSFNSSMNPLKHGFSVVLATIKWRLRIR